MTHDPPPIACTLGADETPGRIEEWKALASRSVAREGIEGGIRLRFPPDPGLAGTVADLAQREQSCCSFFDFAVGIGRDEIHLDVRAPEGAASIVDALFTPS